MVTAMDALTVVSGEWETRKGEAEREGDPGLIWCVIYVE